MLANKILENFPACSHLLKPARLFIFWKFSCLLVYYILLVYSRSNFVNKVTHIAKDGLERLCDLLKIEQKILFLMNFCNVSPLNCLKITNFYCTRVKLQKFDDYLRIKVIIILKKFPPCWFIRACLIIDTSWIFLPACLLQPARLFKFHGISSLLVY